MLNAVYDIPYYARTLRPVFGGWSLSGIATARSGRPVNITLSRPATVVPGGYNLAQRPDVVAGVPMTPPGGSTPAQGFNRAAIAVPAAGAWFNAGRNLGRGPSLYQIDQSVARHIALSERTCLEVRAEAFNLLNRTPVSRSDRRRNRTGTVWPHSINDEYHAHWLRNAAANPVHGAPVVLMAALQPHEKGGGHFYNFGSLIHRGDRHGLLLTGSHLNFNEASLFEDRSWFAHGANRIEPSTGFLIHPLLGSFQG